MLRKLALPDLNMLASQCSLAFPSIWLPLPSPRPPPFPSSDVCGRAGAARRLLRSLPGPAVRAVLPHGAPAAAKAQAAPPPASCQWSARQPAQWRPCGWCGGAAAGGAAGGGSGGLGGAQQPGRQRRHSSVDGRPARQPAVARAAGSGARAGVWCVGGNCGLRVPVQNAAKCCMLRPQSLPSLSLPSPGSMGHPSAARGVRGRCSRAVQRPHAPPAAPRARPAVLMRTLGCG